MPELRSRVTWQKMNLTEFLTHPEGTFTEVEIRTEKQWFPILYVGPLSFKSHTVAYTRNGISTREEFSPKTRVRVK
jgi:hypothetical protein